MSIDHELRHGQPKITRNEAYKHDKYTWRNGFELFLYDDGRVKLGCWDATVSVSDVSNFKPGKSQGSAHVIARFKSTKDDDSETHD